MILCLIKDIEAHVDSEKLEAECKIADICHHDQVPICGIDSCGEMRTFIDTCDMHEFNCDSKKGKTLHISVASSDLSFGDYLAVGIWAQTKI
ncbi:unnamed protein product [Chrysodeixis includens]|uniref:Kazal-like domain-containing protein n=1 Tax=Chrysodeixis includens TaxID=689277 RepID=A0A9N8Q1F9_CHRIL|nr:unnamed protein product [Chrysodeixis includens]